MSLPASSYELIKMLDKMYPQRCIRPEESEMEARAYAKVRLLIDGLVQAVEDEKESE